MTALDLLRIARRLRRLERALGEQARRDAAHAALVAIGAVALAEAERRAGLPPPRERSCAKTAADRRRIAE